MKAMRIKIKKRMADCMAVNQVNHQFVSVNQNVINIVNKRLNQIATYLTDQRYLVHSFKKRLEHNAISIWTEIIHTTQFTIKLLFARPTVKGIGSSCDIGALCI